MCNNDYTLITKEISNLVSEKNIVIWKSEMDGLGTSLSDIDAYCICDEEKNFKNFSFNGIPVDIEYINNNFTPYTQDLLFILLADRFHSNTEEYKTILDKINNDSIRCFKETVDRTEFNSILEVV